MIRAESGARRPRAYLVPLYSLILAVKSSRAI